MENKLFQAIANITNEIKVGKSPIDTKGAGNYKAFTADKVLEETKKLLPKNNVCTFVQNDIIETQYITKKTQYGDRTTHNVIVKTSVIFVHTTTGEQFTSYAVGEASDGGDKALSKAQTDGFKKVLCQVFHLFDDDGDKDNVASDDDKITKATKQTPKEPIKQVVQEKKLTEVEYAKLEDGIKNCQTVGKLIEYATTTLTNNKPKMSETQYNKLKTMLDGYKNTLTKAEVDKINAKNN